LWSGAKVRDVVRSPLYTVDVTAKVVEAAKLMAEKRISGVVVTENGKPVGIVTERDIVSRVVAKNLDPSKTPVKNVMSSPLITVDINTNLIEAVDLMNRKKVRRIVVTENNEVVGIFTVRDVLALNRICSYCGKEAKTFPLTSEPAHKEVLVECSCGAVYHMDCAKIIVYCVHCSQKLVTEVYYPAPEETFAGD